MAVAVGRGVVGAAEVVGAMTVVVVSPSFVEHPETPSASTEHTTAMRCING